MRQVGACSAGSSTMSPRRMAALDTSGPVRFSAHRSPASPAAAGLFCACSERTRAGRPNGLSITRSPGRTDPDSTVPVTTSPTPDRENTRSTASRKPAEADRLAVAAAATANRSRSPPMPWPVSAETGTISAPSSTVPAIAVRIWPARALRRSGVAVSALVSATNPRPMPSKSMIARCSSVCGLMPSSAATTNRAKSIPPAPASIVCTKRSWPGTSMKPSTAPPSIAR